MKTIIHVNQHIIKANRKNGTSEPCLMVRRLRVLFIAHTIRSLVERIVGLRLKDR